MHEKFTEIISVAQHVVVVQADNPDADSLGSALALEHILGDLGKTVTLYCGVDVPTYLRYLPGWDRVVKELPKQFDASIIVDASTYTLLEQLHKTGQLPWLKSKPAIVLDHHKIVEKNLDFAAVSIVDADCSSTGELIYRSAKEQAWQVSSEAGLFLMASILGDTQGLTNDLTKANTYRVMAELTDLGVNRPALEELRREASKMPQIIYNYKGALLSRTAFTSNGKVAYLTVPQPEINEYSPLYNPAALVQFDMLQTQDVVLSIVFKTYDDGHVTAALRSNAPVAAQLAEYMGGGGHEYASGFKTEPNQDFQAVIARCLAKADELVNKDAA